MCLHSLHFLKLGRLRCESQRTVPGSRQSVTVSAPGMRGSSLAHGARRWRFESRLCLCASSDLGRVSGLWWTRSSLCSRVTLDESLGCGGLGPLRSRRRSKMCGSHCRHLFHKSCVDPWLLDHRTCPMCKMNILKALGIPVSTAQPTAS